MANSFIKRANAETEYSPNDIQELAKCANDPVYFIKNYVKIQHPTKGIVPFELFDYQLEMIDCIHNNKDTIILCSRQLGKTTVVSMYILWLATFQRDVKAVIASKAMNHATEIMSRIKYAYEELPHWLKAGCKFYNRTSIEFDNGSSIKSEATSEKTGRGGSPTIVFLDEIAFISKRIQDELWASLAPSLSTGGKFILTSTPNGDDDLYANLWRGANSGTNSFKPFMALWNQHPDRGPDYYKDMAGKLGPVKVRQELDCEFLSSDSLLIDPIKLNTIKHDVPMFEEQEFKFWQQIETRPGQCYLVSIDPATGSGNDFSVIEVFHFPSLEQVAEFRTNRLHIPFLYDKIKWILNKLTEQKGGHRNEVFWTFERNGIGEAICALYTVDEKQNDYADLYSPDAGKLGIFTVNRSKVLAALQLKTLVEKAKNGFKLHSQHLIYELKNFIARGGTYEAKAGSTDDAVMATIGITRLLKFVAEFDDRAFKAINEYESEEDYQNQAAEDSDEPIPFSI